MLNLEQTLSHATIAVKTTAEFIQRELGRVGAEHIIEKDLHSLVSYVDVTAEKMLVKELGRIVPEAAFLTEEGTVDQKQAALQWIIDPLDGTTNFLHQIPHFSISVALQSGNETLIGIVHEVNRNECFAAYQNGGAFANELPIKVSQTQRLPDSLIATGFPYYDFSRMTPYFEALEYLTQHTRGLRRFGSAALDLAWVACGRFDSFFEYSLNPWDVAAGALLVQEAGGRVCDFSGGSNYLFGRELLATNLLLHKDMLGLVGKYFEEER